MIETYLFEYLIAFAEEGSLLKASEKLHISQPSLTRAMQKLEDYLDISLFERTGNKITLNDEGNIVLNYARDIINLNYKLDREIKDIKDKKKTLNVGLTAPGPLYRFANLFYFQENLRVSSEIDNEDNIINKIKKGFLDLGFINHNINDQDLICQKAFTEHLYVALPQNHFLAGFRDGLYFKDIDGQSFVLAKNLGFWHQVVDKYLPKSRLLYQEDGNLSEIVANSTLPSFATNVTTLDRTLDNRVLIPILDDEAKYIFYAIVRKKNKDILKKLK